MAKSFWQRGEDYAKKVSGEIIEQIKAGVAHPVGPHRGRFDASCFRGYVCIRVWLLGLSPLVADRPTSRETSCSSYGSPRPSIRSSG